MQDYTIDSDNIITLPLTYWTRSGMLRDGSALQCGYRCGWTEHTRSPANPDNVDALLSDPPRDAPPSFVAKLRLRAVELFERMIAFTEADVSKTTGTVVDHSSFLVGGVEHRFGYDAAPSHYPSPAPGKVKLYRQQVAAATLFDRCRTVLLAMQQRTGKTITVLSVAREKLRTGEIDAVFIMAPRSLLDTAWKFDRELCLPEYQSVIMSDDKARDWAVDEWNERDGCVVYLSTFESAAKNWSVVREMHNPARVMVIGDESIKIKTPKAKRTLGTLSACREAGYVALLSGAPVSKHYADIWAQMYAIDPGLLGDSYDAFEYSFIDKGDYGRESFKRGMKQVYDHIASHAIFRCTRGEAEQFSGRDTVTRNVRLKMHPTQSFIYKQMLNSFIAQYDDEETGEELSSEATNILVQLLRLREICGGFFSFEYDERCYARVRLPSNPKLDWIERYLDENEGTQCIIFCEFDEEEHMICDLLDRLHITYGGHEAVRRKLASSFTQTVAEFQDGDRQVFVGKHSAIGHGITLSAADAAIFYNLGFNSDNYDQARMRPVAGGKCAIIYHLMMAGSIETEKIYPTLRNRGSMKDDLMNDVRRKGYYSFFEEMSKTVLEEVAATTGSDDPLERAARKATGYDGPSSLRDLDAWLYGGQSNDLLSKIESMRGMGSIRTAYRSILRFCHPDVAHLKGLSREEATAVTLVTIEAMKEDQPWSSYIGKIKNKLSIASGDRRQGDDTFDAFVAYMRAKFGG